MGCDAGTRVRVESLTIRVFELLRCRRNDLVELFGILGGRCGEM